MIEYPQPERTAVHLQRWPDGFKRTCQSSGSPIEVTTHRTDYVTPAYEDPEHEDEEGMRWEVRSVAWVNGARVERALCRTLTLDEAKMRVDWMIAFTSRRYLGNFDDWRLGHRRWNGAT